MFWLLWIQCSFLTINSLLWFQTLPDQTNPYKTEGGISAKLHNFGQFHNFSKLAGNTWNIWNKGSFAIFAMFLFNNFGRPGTLAQGSKYFNLLWDELLWAGLGDYKLRKAPVGNLFLLPKYKLFEDVSKLCKTISGKYFPRCEFWGLIFEFVLWWLDLNPLEMSGDQIDRTYYFLFLFHCLTE